MANTELIEALRCDGKCNKPNCPYSMDDRDWCDEYRIITDAANALESDEKQIAELEAQNELKDGTITAMAMDIEKLQEAVDNYEKLIAELSAQIPKEGERKWNSLLNEYEWVDTTIYCPNCGADMRGASNGNAG